MKSWCLHLYIVIIIRDTSFHCTLFSKKKLIFNVEVEKWFLIISFIAFFSRVFLDERLGAAGYLGAALIIAGVLLSSSQMKSNEKESFIADSNEGILPNEVQL